MEIQLTNGMSCLIDAEDFEIVANHRWKMSHSKKSKKRYAFAKILGRTVYMHRLLLRAPVGVDVDHQNGNGLDNRRANLRLANRSQNMANTHRNGRKYKGICLTKSGRWMASICLNYRSIHLGTFSTAEEAAKAYDKAAKIHFGEFALLNFST